ncbi:MAG: hypothetical protein Q9226_002664 [Calogaya cf. arnoldii]
MPWCMAEKRSRTHETLFHSIERPTYYPLRTHRRPPSGAKPQDLTSENLGNTFWALSKIHFNYASEGGNDMKVYKDSTPIVQKHVQLLDGISLLLVYEAMGDIVAPGLTVENGTYVVYWAKNFAGEPMSPRSSLRAPQMLSILTPIQTPIPNIPYLTKDILVNDIRIAASFIQRFPQSEPLAILTSQTSLLAERTKVAEIRAEIKARKAELTGDMETPASIPSFYWEQT